MSQPIPRGYVQLTGLSSAKSPIVPAGANFAIIRCTGSDVRWRDDGGTPTGSVGQPLQVGDELVYDSPVGLPNLKFAEQSVGAEVSITFYGV